MTPETFVVVAEVLVAIAFLLWLFSDQWRDFLADVSRHHYFILRQRMFLMAADGRIAFSDPAYLGLEHKLDIHMQFADTDTIERFIAIVTHGPLDRHLPESPIQNLHNSIDALEDTTVKNDLQEILRAVDDIRISHMLASSPMLCLLSAITVLPVAMVLALKPNLISMFRKITEQVARLSSDMLNADANYNVLRRDTSNPPRWISPQKAMQ